MNVDVSAVRRDVKRETKAARLPVCRVKGAGGGTRPSLLQLTAMLPDAEKLTYSTPSWFTRVATNQLMPNILFLEPQRLIDLGFWNQITGCARSTM